MLRSPKLSNFMGNERTYDLNMASLLMQVDHKVIWKIAVLSLVDCKSKYVKGQIRKVTWRIMNFSSIREEKYSGNFTTLDGNKWRILIIPKENNSNLSIYLDVADPAKLPFGWSRYVQVGVAIINQINRKPSTVSITRVEFNAHSTRGFCSFLPLSEFHDPKRGYLINNECLVEVYVSTDTTKDLISRDAILETYLDKYKMEEAVDCAKAAASDNQESTITKQAEITTPNSLTKPSSCQQIVDIEPDEPSEEDMTTFFTGLEAVLSSSNIVSSKKEAKDALVKIDEAMNMTPINFFNLGKFLPLKHAINVLARFDCTSIPLTIEQKNELLAMEEILKELADRAGKAEQEKHHLTENQSKKLTVTRNLDRNLIRYKEVDSEVKQVEQKLAVLLAERKDIFTSSREIKMEFEALENEWPEYEAKAKVAEEEEKMVEAEWGRMKEFISSIKESFENC